MYSCPGNTRQLQLLNKYLNSLSPKLKFTLEIENNSKINFLDLTIEKVNSKFIFNIYRKPTTTNQTIHASSYHPFSHKLAAYNSMVNRLIKVPLTPENYAKELNIIKHIALSNGYDTKMVDGIVKKYMNKTIKQNDTENAAPPKYIPIEYGHRLNSLLKKELKQFNIIPATRTSNKTERLLRPKPQVPKNKLEKTGVYKLKCSDCDKFYIGQTGRSFSKRFKEHKPNPRINPQKSSFAQHLIDLEHSPGTVENNVEVVEICEKGYRLDTLEEFHIYKALKTESLSVLNEKLNYSSHLIFNKIIQTQAPRTSPSVIRDDPPWTSPMSRTQSSTRSRNRRLQCPRAGYRDGSIK